MSERRNDCHARAAEPLRAIIAVLRSRLFGLGVRGEDLKDAVQDGLLALARHWHLEKSSGSNKTRGPAGRDGAYAAVVAVGVAARHLDRGRRRSLENSADADVAELAGCDGCTAEERILLWSLLARLDPDDAAAYVLVEGYELSRLRTSALLGVSEGVLANRLRRARRRLTLLGRQP